MRPDFDASVFRQAGKARAQGLDGAKKKDRKIDVATFVSPGILACIRAKISEHQRENALRPAEAMAKRESPPLISVIPKINFRPILLGFLKKWDNSSQKSGIRVDLFNHCPSLFGIIYLSTNLSRRSKS